MQVVEQNVGGQAVHGIDEIVPRLVSDIGTKKFEASLTDFAGRTVHCRQITAFAIKDDGSPKTVALFATDKAEAVKSAAKRYCDVHWRRDPTNTIHATAQTGKENYAILMGRADVDDSEFLSDCYVRPGVGYRLSIVTRHGADLLKISFHRPADEGEFSEGSIVALLDRGPVLASLIFRHVELTSSTTVTNFDRTHFEALLSTRCPALTGRERTVCSMIAIGMSSEAIALTLQISVNTVLTFRRRAYSRLNISTQNELMRLLFTGDHSLS